MRHTLLSSCLAGSVLIAQTGFAQTVTVQEGDTLFSIASAQMGKGLDWPELCAFNDDVLQGNCNLVRPGMVLAIPGSAAVAEPEPEPEVVVAPEPEVAPVEEVVEEVIAPVPAPEPEPETAPEPEITPEPEAQASATPEGVEDAPAPEDVTQDTTVDEAADAEPALEPEAVDIVYDFSQMQAHVFIAPEGLEANHQLPDGPVRLSGHIPDSSPSGRPGTYLILPPELEAAVAGNTVVIEMLARLDQPGAIDIAYSTNEVGNSGWQRFELGTAYDRIEMRYAAPEQLNGNGDYLGVLPDPLNTGQVLEISFIGISIIE